jgi:hypothetical protein
MKLCHILLWNAVGGFLSVLLTNSTEQTHSWKANSHSASQEIPQLLWNQNIHYRVHKSLPLVSILNQTYPVHTLPRCFSKINSNSTQ